MICLELAGCAGTFVRPQFLDTALDDVVRCERENRDALWQDLAGRDRNDPAVVLLQSLPGHSGYAPQAARQALERALAEGGMSASTERLLRLRLTGLKRELTLSALLEERERRLKSLIEIEQQLNAY